MDSIKKMFPLKRAALLFALTVGAVASAQAASYPNKPIKIIVPFSAGGVVDTITRIIAEPLSEKYGQAVVVENKTGAGGSIGGDYVARSKPDGYTLLSVSPGHAVVPSVIENVNWHPVKDFRAIEGFGIVPNAFVVHPDVKATTIVEFIELAKNSPTPLTYGTAGIGTSNHLSGALLAEQANIELEQVPYRGQSDAVLDLVAGRLDSMPLTVALALPHINAGKLRALAVTTKQRATALPDVPTIAEAANLPNYEVGTWFGFVAPKAVSDDIVTQLSTDIAEILDRPAIQEKLVALGLEIEKRSPKEFDAYIEDEYLKWSALLKDSGAKK